MMQAFLFGALSVVGTLTALALSPALGARLAAAGGLLVGWAVWVAASVALVLLRIPFQGVNIGWVLVAITSGAALAAWRRRALVRANVLGGATAALAVVVVTALASLLNTSVLSYDSHHFVALGRALAQRGGLDAELGTALAEWGIFQVAVQAAATFIGVSYLYSLPLVFWLSFAVFFVLLLGRALTPIVPRRRERVGIVGLVAAAMLSTYFVLFQSFYIHSNFAAAAYLLGFVAVTHLAVAEGDARFVPLATLFLWAFTLQRIETLLPAALFLALLLAERALPLSTWRASLGVYALALVAWFGTLATRLPADSTFLTPRKLVPMLALLFVVVAGYWLGALAIVAKLRMRLAEVVLGVLVVALVTTSLLAGSHMAKSGYQLVSNMHGGGFWGGMWHGIAVLALAASWFPRPAAGRLFSHGVVGYLLLIVFLSFFRTPYRAGWGDSGNRMLLHVVPLVFFYFGLKFSSLWADAHAAGATTSTTAITAGARPYLPPGPPFPDA